jgi:hypothetical protein
VEPRMMYTSSIELWCDQCKEHLFYLIPCIDEGGRFNEVLVPESSHEMSCRMLLHREVEDVKRKSLTRFNKPCPQCGEDQLSMSRWNGWISYPRTGLENYLLGFDSCFTYRYPSPAYLAEVKKSVRDNVWFDELYDFRGRCDLFRAGFIDGLDFVRDFVFYRIQGNVVLRVPEY